MCLQNGKLDTPRAPGNELVYCMYVCMYVPKKCISLRMIKLDCGNIDFINKTILFLIHAFVDTILTAPTNLSDQKELIPEFFTGSGKFLSNSPRSGTTVHRYAVLIVCLNSWFIVYYLCDFDVYCTFL